jgi:hypothetical protein
MVPNLDQDPNISVSKQIDVYFSEVVQKEAKEKEGKKGTIPINAWIQDSFLDIFLCHV